MTPYWEWVRSDAALIDTDGCSHVSGFSVEYCYEHDLAYFHAADPVDAYRLWRHGVADYWGLAKPITRREVDARFRRRHQANSKFGRWSPMALWRWFGVMRYGQAAWDRHRQREREALGV